MKKPTFWEGVLLALAVSLTGASGFYALSFVLPENCAIRLVISALAIAYLLYLLNCSRERSGRITVMLSWFMVLGTLWFFNPPLILFLILQVLAIWLIRSLYFYGSLFASLADLGLCAFGIASAIWALHHTGSLFLTLWCFFLAQALFPVILAGTRQSNLDEANISNSETDFKRAYLTAEAAARKLSTFN